MALKTLNIPCLFEDFSSTPEILESISQEIKKIEKKFQAISHIVTNVPCLLFFNRKTPLDKVFSFLRNRKEAGNNYTISISVGKDDVDKATYWELLNEGASDVLCWESLFNASEVIVKRVERWLEIENVLQSPKIKKNIIGCSDKWLSTLREVVEVARFSNLSVLITGESGTGKELISRLIHQLDTRIDKSDLILTDCSSISSELSGSEFFGHEKGAYTNAIASRDGAFALANKGTLFLDEIGELPLSLQAELLRVIQEGTYKRVGSNIWKQTDFRLVSATNKNLVDEVHQHRFRQDLYFRLSGWVIELPPLRERIADIPQLVEHFLTEAFNGEKYVEVDDKLMSFLTSRSYPGNIRELKQLVNRLVLKYPGTGPLTIGLLPKEELRSVKSEVENMEYNSLLHQGIHKSILTGIGVKEIKDMVGNIAIKIALGQENGNIQRAALKLGLTDRSIQLWTKMNGDLQSLDDTLTEN